MLSNAQIVPYIPVKDVSRAREFYEEKVGLTPKQDTPAVLFTNAARDRGYSCIHPQAPARPGPVRRSGRWKMLRPKSPP